jgi:anti-sigma regulatory factor (Ser/Thr protein kinase)
VSVDSVDPKVVKAPFAHEAFFYAGDAAFVAGLGTFVGDGLDAGEPVLVVVSARKIDLLQAHLGRRRASAVTFADMATVGRNPACIIPAWQDFVDAHRGQPMRGVGEPIGPERDADELAECQRHESLLNLAFGEGPSWRLLCPYDLASLPSDVVDIARRNHPFVTDARGTSPSDHYDPGDFGAGFAAPFRAPSGPVCEWQVTEASIRDVRDAVRAMAAGVRTPISRREDFVLAVNEIATNSLRHGGGHGTLRAWREGDALVCEVRDQGFIREPLAGRRRPDVEGQSGRGLWLTNQLCDLVQVRSSRAGTAIRLHLRD